MDIVEDPRLSRDVRRRIAEDNGLGGKDRPLEPTGASRKIPRIPGWLLAPVEPLSANPLVVAVSPMTQVQAMEIRSLQSRRDELALKLALALRYLGLKPNQRPAL